MYQQYGHKQNEVDVMDTVYTKVQIENSTVKQLIDIAKENGIVLSAGLRRNKALLSQHVVVQLFPPAPAKVDKPKIKVRKIADRKSPIADSWSELFQQNEKYWESKQQSKILTDPELTEAMYTRFPKKKSVVFTQVALVRARYNRGAQAGQDGTPPEILSHQYYRQEKNGKAVVVQVPRRVPKNDMECDID